MLKKSFKGGWHLSYVVGLFYFYTYTLLSPPIPSHLHLTT